MSRVGERKIRSDKKRDVKPTISLDLKDAIYRLSYITQTPVKDVCEQLVLYAVKDSKIFEDLSLYFVRDIRIRNTLHLGDREIKPIAKREYTASERITLRLTQHDYEILTRLAYALDVRPTRVCAVLLKMGMSDFRFVNNYVARYLHGRLTDSQTKELSEIARYLRKVTNEKYTLASLLSVIVEEVSAPITRVKDAVDEFIVKYWRE